MRATLFPLVGLALAAALVVPCVPVAAADGPPDRPFLRVEAGAHLAPVNAIRRLADGRIATVSDDQTLRIWSAADGELLQTVRGAAGPRDQGALYALAAHGRFLAAGGRAGWTWGNNRTFVRVVDSGTTQPLGLLSGLPTPIAALDFDAAGAHLAVGLFGGGSGVRVFRLGQGDPVLQDRSFPDGVTDLAFLADGRLAVAEPGGSVRLYDVGSSRRIELAAVRDGRPWRLAAAPETGALAVGLRERAAVALYAPGSNRARLLEVPGLDLGGLPVVAWSSDGSQLFAAGRAGAATRDWAIHRWSADGGYRGAWVLDAVTPTALAAAPDGGVFVGDAAGRLRRLGSEGGQRFLVAGNAPRLRGLALTPLQLSADGSTVGFVLDTAGTRRVTFDIGERRLSRGAAGLSARTDDGRIEIDRVRGTVRIDGRQLPLDPGERALAGTTGPGGTYVTTNFYLRAYDRGRVLWRQPLAAPGWGVAASRDGRFVVTARGDGTLQWRDAGDGRIRLSLYATRDLQDWVLWTPQGFFDHSKAGADGRGGADLIGYHVNRGPRDAAEFLPIERLYRTYYRSDVVSAAFRDGPGDRAIVDQAVASLDDAADHVREVRPPRLQLTEVCGVDMHGSASGCSKAILQAGTRGALPVLQSAERAPDTVELILDVTDQGSGIGRLDVRRNGAVVNNYLSKGFDMGDGAVVRLRVPLVEGRNAISVRAYDADGKVATAPVEIRVDGPPESAAPPVVRVLAVGVSKYWLDEISLQTAHNDAQAIGEAFDRAGQRKDLFARAEVTTLIDSQATTERLRTALADLAEVAQPRDTVVLYMAGHGMVIDGDYYFAPHDVGQDSPNIVQDIQAQRIMPDVGLRQLFRRSGLPQRDLMADLGRIAAERVVVILDTCYAAGFTVMTQAQRDDLSISVAQRVGRESGRFVLGSARGQANDVDRDPYATDYPPGTLHGMFTAALLEAIRGKGDRNDDARLSVAEAGEYVKLRVREASRNIEWGVPQSPVAHYVGDPYFPLIDVPRDG